MGVKSLGGKGRSLPPKAREPILSSATVCSFNWREVMNLKKTTGYAAYKRAYDEAIEEGKTDEEAREIGSSAAEDELANYGDWLHDQERDRRMMDDDVLKMR